MIVTPFIGRVFLYCVDMERHARAWPNSTARHVFVLTWPINWPLRIAIATILLPLVIVAALSESFYGYMKEIWEGKRA